MPESLGLFVTASLVLLLIPGPAVLYIVARSADQGRQAGLVSVAGIHLGTLVHRGARRSRGVGVTLLSGR